LKDSGIKYNVIYLQKLPFVFGERNRDFETALENRGQISLVNKFSSFQWVTLMTNETFK
jgi:hypothetical protein